MKTVAIPRSFIGIEMDAIPKAVLRATGFEQVFFHQLFRCRDNWARGSVGVVMEHLSITREEFAMWFRQLKRAGFIRGQYWGTYYAVTEGRVFDGELEHSLITADGNVCKPRADSYLVIRTPVRDDPDWIFRSLRTWEVLDEDCMRIWVTLLSCYAKLNKDTLHVSLRMCGYDPDSLEVGTFYLCVQDAQFEMAFPYLNVLSRLQLVEVSVIDQPDKPEIARGEARKSTTSADAALSNLSSEITQRLEAAEQPQPPKKELKNGQ